MPPSRILGFGGSGHDWAVAAIENGEVVAAVAEERTSRLKHGLGSNLLDSTALKAVLQTAGWSVSDVDIAVACDLVPMTLVAPFRRRLTRIRHHLAHAYAAYYGSGFDVTAILIADHSGSPLQGGIIGDGRTVETVTGWHADADGIRCIFEYSGSHDLNVKSPADYYQHVRVDNSLGDLYRLTCEKLDFISSSGPDSISDDGKAMGLAAYGDDRFVERITDFVDVSEAAGFLLPLRDRRLADLMDGLLASGPEDELGERRGALARASQAALEKALLALAIRLRRQTGDANLALAGGCMLNCCANTKIAAEAGYDLVYAFPAASDDGIALGTALFGSARIAVVPPRRVSQALPFLGPIRPSASAGGEPSDAVISEICQRLETGQIIGWYEGRSEFGPRALGHRSILADPRPVEIRDRINAIIKRREGFRPFAPMVLADRADELFEIPDAARPMLPFMLSVVPVRADWRSRIAAAVHVDGTARVQTVEPERIPTIHRLLTAWERVSGVPVLLNTSFNRAGDPIVETPEDALTSFREMDLDCLVLDGRIIDKSDVDVFENGRVDETL